MNRPLAIAALALFLPLAAAADETTEIYQSLYKQADGLAQKYAAALSLVALNDKSTAPVLGEALSGLLLAGQAYAGRSDQELYGRNIRILAQALGDYKYAPSAPDLWDASRNVPDVLARAEALMALGKMRALDYAERISLELQDLNLKPTTDRDEGEKLAYACVIALGKMKDARGFSPVFFAADSWYSQRVRQQAAASLPDIADDPTDPIKAIIASETAGRQLRALKAETASKAPADRKTEVAVLALGQGHLKVPRDKDEAKALSDLRKLALRSLVAYQASGEAPVAGCVASYQGGLDDEERLLALGALGVNASDPAASALRDILLRLNEDQKAGISDEVRNRMAKAAIENAAVSKNKLLRPALLAISIDDKWSGGIIAAAKAALKAIP